MEIQNEQDIPIDIHSNKLLDWLVSRRHCSRDWQKNILTIRKKINNAIQDMPAVEEIAQLLSGTYITYFHCCHIVELLKETEASSKNIFGHYSSQRMKDWQEIIKLYEQDNAYLAEAAQMLIRNVSYEVPSLKRQIVKCKQTQEECLKKEADYEKNANDMRGKYYTACKQLGISGNNVKKELISLLDELPEAFTSIGTLSKDMQDARDYYLSFLNFTLQKDCDDMCLPLIKYIMTKGNTTTYEWRTGESPDIVEVTTPILPLDVDNGSITAADDQIDFGDFGITSESGDDRSSSSPNGDFVHVDRDDCRADNGGQINFGDTDSDINWDIAVETPGISVIETEAVEGGKVARGEDALSLLDNEVTRNVFFNELLEVEGFLEQRLIEMQMECDILSSNQFQSASSSLQLQSVDSIKEMLTTVKDVSSQLMSVKLQHLYLIKSSPKYVDRLGDSLKSKLELSEKMVQCQKAMSSKYHEALDEQKILEPKVDLIIRKTKMLQGQIEKDISKRYKNRPVNIMGGINIM